MRCGGLYGAAAAALLVVPVVLARPAVHDPENEATTPKIVTLDVSKIDQGPEAVTFHLDVRPSGRDCNPSDIRINGHVLDSDVSGEGEGVLSVPGGRQAMATWAFGCIDPDEGPLVQTLDVVLRQLDGQEVRAVGFSTIVSQRTNSMAVQKFPEEDGDYPTQIFHIDDELEAQLRELDFSGPPARPLSECGASLSCMWAYLSRCVKHAASKLGDEVAELNDFISHAHHDALSTTPEEGEDEDWWNDWESEVETWDGWDGEVEIWDEDGNRLLVPQGGGPALMTQHPMTLEEMDAWEEVKVHDYRFYARQPPMLMTIALAVLALCSLSLWGIHYLHRRTARLSRKTEHEAEPSKGRDHGRDGRRRRRSERRARRAARKTAAAGFVSSLLARWTLRGDTANEDEKGALRQRYDSEEESLTTMEDEIAQLRQVASFVDDIVAAEEGRARRQQQQHQQQERQPPAYSRTSLGETCDAEQGPPPYDSVSNGALSSPDGANGSRPISGDQPGSKE